MQKKMWLMIALLLVIPGLLFMVGCQKKAVTQAKAPGCSTGTGTGTGTGKSACKGASSGDAPADTSGMIMAENIHFDFDRSTS